MSKWMCTKSIPVGDADFQVGRVYSTDKDGKLLDGDGNIRLKPNSYRNNKFYSFKLYKGDEVETRKWKCVGNSESDAYFTLNKVYSETKDGCLIDDEGDERIGAKTMNTSRAYPNFELVDASKHRNPESPHYEKGKDTFAWAEEHLSASEIKAVVKFMMHKYLTREKGQNDADRKKALDYLEWGEEVAG